MTGVFPINSGRFTADYIVQPSDLAGLAGGLNAMDAMVDKDSVLLREASGPIAAGDLVSSDAEFEKVSVAATKVGPLGIALTAAVAGETVKILVFGTRTMSVTVTGTPAVGWVLYCIRPADAADGVRWTYHVAADLPDEGLLIGQVAAAGAKVQNLWTGLCDVRMGPGAIVAPQRNVGAVLWTGDALGVKVFQAGNGDIASGQRPTLRLALPAATPVSTVTFLGGDLFFRGKRDAVDFTGLSAWKKVSVDLDHILYNNSYRWGPPDAATPRNYLSIQAIPTWSFQADLSITSSVLWKTSANASGANLAYTAGTQRFRICLTVNTAANALDLAIPYLSGPALPWTFGVHELYALCRNFTSEAATEHVNEYAAP